MNSVVLVKPVFDNAKLKFKEGLPVKEGVPLIMNPFDEYALETALRVKEQSGSGTVTAIAFASDTAKEILKKAIAAGADAAVLVLNDGLEELDAFAVAVILSKVILAEVPDCQLILSGQSSLDYSSGQTGVLVAGMLDHPALSFVKSVTLDNAQVTLTRETEQGLETFQMVLPGSIAVTKCDYELRSSNIKGVMKANKTVIPVKSVTDYGLNAEVLKKEHTKTAVVKLWQKPEKNSGTVLKGIPSVQAVEQLVAYLEHEKVV